MRKPSRKAGAERRAPLKHSLAKRLRAEMTYAETKLWTLLRRKNMACLRFRRQQPIGSYVADFFCPAAKLIVELDGSQHGERAHLRRDDTRTKWLEAQGYRVLRIWNAEFLKHPESALDCIWRAIRDSGGPLPEALRASTLPQGEGKKDAFKPSA
ncbi:MAG TPA: DUF559 domain-containing protein [Rhizomicrobium sp.]|jgi:very-short-patch-repair endonuclease|nr:DUF559 domain-containing protein [Rhizomicrobium sp.]